MIPADGPLVAGALAMTALVALSGLHVAWGLGLKWPGRSGRELSTIVAGSTKGAPPPIACFVVAAALGVNALLVAQVTGVVPSIFPGQLAGTLMWLSATVFALRGAYGYVDHVFRPRTLGLPFYRLNRRLFSPICIAMAVLLALSNG